jgi:hypothetical protein
MSITFKLDVLKPHQPNSPTLARALKQIEGVKYVNIRVEEIDQKTTSIIILIRGSEALLLDKIIEVLDSNNCALHSVDEVTIQDD